MERKWTEEQRAAIDDRGNTLLVSASAGSGKTSVLTARIISRLLDPEYAADISRILVVTFTRASAADLREKISDALSAAVAKNPGDKHLRNQLLSLGGAQISTIHSFCTTLIRENFDALGIGAGARIADETEIKLIVRDVFDAAVNEFYENGEKYGIENFSVFCENFERGRDEKIADIFSEMYKKLGNHPRGIDFLLDTAEEYYQDVNRDFFDTVIGKTVRKEFFDMLGLYGKIYDDALKYGETDEAFEKAYLPGFTNDREIIESLLNDKNNGYCALRSAVASVIFTSLGRIKGEKNEETVFFYNERNNFKAFIKGEKGTAFEYSQEEISAYYVRLADEVKKLYCLLSYCEKKLNEEKRRRGILDYSDLERLTLSLLKSDDGENGGVAAALRERFDEIYIDEYQDVNPLQDGIFRLICKDNNRFMVGDVKQSIYGFRGANPGFFTEYKKRFSEKDGGGKTLYLSSNFRSGKKAVDFVNAVAGTIFLTKAETVGYTKKDNLVYARPGEDPSVPAEIDIVGKGSEAEFCAKRIKRLIEEDGYRPGQIAVLLRRNKNAAVYADALSSLGIPCRAAKKKGLLEGAEVLLLICLLNTIDNPGRDIYLAGTLKSALYGFSLEELERIRTENREGNLFTAFCAYAEKSGDKRAKYFLEELEFFREFSSGSSVDSLIWRIFQRTTILSSGKSEGRDNLLCFYETARCFESGSFRGLYNFLNYVNDAMKSGGLEEFSPSDSDDTVKIMTVHGSKGLEFPVCMICDSELEAVITPGKGNDNNKLIIDYNSGVTFLLSDKTGFGRIITPQHSALVRKSVYDSAEEEMRTIYVALTRASERLIIISGSNKPYETIEKVKMDSEYFCFPMLVNREKSIFEWIYSALLFSRYTDYTLNIIEPEEETKSAASENTADSEEESYTPQDPALVAEIEKRLSFVYPHARALELPSKLTASVIYPGILDDEEEEYKKPRLSKCPRFISAVSDYTPAAAGTATHVFMQFCSFSQAEISPEEEAQRLLTDGFITAKMVEMIDFNAVKQFFKSRLYAEMKKSRRIEREKRFGTEMPAEELTLDETAKNELTDETIFVQGVIDCFFENENGEIVLVDYKTDRFSKTELDDPDNVANILINRHRTQLGYYRYACEKLLCRGVDRVCIYSFALGDSVEIPYSPL